MIVENTASPRSKKAIQQKISLFNILTCLLCTSKAKMAHICPNCSKFYCQICIKQWIKQGNTQCPNCSNFISETSIVNCNKLSQDLSNALEALIQLQAQNQTQCQSHGISQTYYCQNCIKSICSDCIVLEIKHRGHNVMKLSKMKIDFNQQILGQLSKIRKSIRDIEKTKEERMQLKNNHSQESKLKLDLLNNQIQKIKNNYNESTNGVIQKYESWLKNNKLIFLSSSKIYEQYSKQLTQARKVELVRKSDQKFNEIKKLLVEQANVAFISKQEINKVKQCGAASLVSQQYAHKTFILNNYTQCRQKQEVIYSDTFNNGNLQWRLKIYPNGVPRKVGQPTLKRCSSSSSFGEEYISIYIELVASVREVGRYQFSIGILSDTDQSKVISQVYEAEFDVGKCWGYDQFANISTLYQKGYINQEEDSLKIIVSVGPPSYYFSILDKDALILKKMERIEQNRLRIQRLKSAVGAKQWMVKQKSQRREKEMSELKGVNDGQIQNVKTPRQKAGDERRGINYKNYMVELLVREQGMRCSEEFDHQSAELRKIYRRISSMNQKNNLLLF